MGLNFFITLLISVLALSYIANYWLAAFVSLACGTLITLLLLIPFGLLSLTTISISEVLSFISRELLAFLIVFFVFWLVRQNRVEKK